MGYMERLLHSLRYVYGGFNFGNFLWAWHLRNQIAGDVFLRCFKNCEEGVVIARCCWEGNCWWSDVFNFERGGRVDRT